MWGLIGFMVGFLAAGAVWLVAAMPFPIPTHVPAGVLLLLALPYGLPAEAAGRALDTTSRLSSLRLGLAGAVCGAITFGIELAALWAVAPRAWAFVVVWLGFPVAVVACLVVAGFRVHAGNSDKPGARA